MLFEVLEGEGRRIQRRRRRSRLLGVNSEHIEVLKLEPLLLLQFNLHKILIKSLFGPFLELLVSRGYVEIEEHQI